MACIILRLALFFLTAQTEGFAPRHHHRVLQAQTQKISLHARINQNIDLDSPKVATQDKLSQGGKNVYCRCWKSETFPLCDGSHVNHNKITGDNVGPLILSAAKSDDGASIAVDVVDDGEKTSLVGKLKSMFKKKENDGGLTTKERLAKLGLSALLSYGFVSNMSYAVALSLSWYGFSKKVSERTI